MEHRETVRIVPDAKTAVLFIHGIVGTPNHFRDVVPLVQLVPENWSFHNILLDGHGGTVDAFAKSSMKKWKTQVWQTFETLALTHDRVILVAHSMGTLFAIQLALEFADRIDNLFLLAVPMRPGLRLFGIANMLKLVFGKIREDRPVELATKQVCGVKTTRKLWKYIGWIPRFLELFAQIRKTEKVMGNLTVPCRAYQSKKDELVMNLSRGVLERNGCFEIVDLPDSTHFYYAPEDRKRICADLNRIIENTPD